MKVLGPEAFAISFYKIFKEGPTAILFKLLHNIEKKGPLSNALYEAKPKQRHNIKSKVQTRFLMNTDAIIPNTTSAN